MMAEEYFSAVRWTFEATFKQDQKIKTGLDVLVLQNIKLHKYIYI